MGIELVKLVVARHGGLSGNAYKVLVRMALTALDEDRKDQPAATYWAGWEVLAMALGHDTDNLSPARRKKVQDYVSRAWNELEAGGLIERSRAVPGFGRRQVIILHVDPLAPHSVGGTCPPEKGGQKAPRNGGQLPP